MSAIQDVHRNAALSNISIAYMNSGFIANDVYPAVRVQKESDFYYVFGKENLNLEQTIKADKGEANKVDYTLSTGQYLIDTHALETLVTPRMIANADSPLDPLQNAIEMLTERIALRLEYDMSNKLCSSATYGTTMQSTTGLPKWNASSGDVIGQVTSGIAQVGLKIGRDANTVIMGEATFRGLQTNTKLMDRIKYGGTIETPARVVTAALAQLFGVDRVLVGKATYNSATNEGRTASYARLWSDVCIAAYIEPTPALMRPSLGYLFRQNGQDRVVETRNADNVATGAKWVRVTDAYDDRLIDANCAYLLWNCVQ